MKRELKELNITIHVGEKTLPTLWVSSKKKIIDQKVVIPIVSNAVENALKELGYEATPWPVL
jgi:hypothetical protein